MLHVLRLFPRGGAVFASRVGLFLVFGTVCAGAIVVLCRFGYTSLSADFPSSFRLLCVYLAAAAAAAPCLFRFWLVDYKLGGDILAISDELRLTEAEWVWLRSHLGILFVSEYTDENTRDIVRSINLKLECMAATIAKLPPSYL